MNFKPTNEQLIDFVYGNLPKTEQLQVEQAIEVDATVKAQIEDLNKSRSFLHNLEDEEILEPDQFLWQLTKKQQKRSILWPITAVAASLTLLLLVAYGTNFRVSYGTFNLAFGAAEPTVLPQGLSNEQVQAMINKSIVSNNVNFVAQMDDTRSEFEEMLAANSKLQLKDMRRIAASTKELPKAQADAYLAQLSNENRTLVNDFFEASAVDQRDYMNTILTDYFEFMDSKQKDILQVLQANIDDIEYRNSQFTQETEQVLASILTSTENEDMLK